MRNPNKQQKALEQIFHEEALVAAEDGESTPGTRAAARRLSAFAKHKVAELHRADTVGRKPSGALQSELARLARPALLRRIDDLRREHPQLAFAHHDLSRLTDDDLRTMIEDAELSLEPS